MSQRRSAGINSRIFTNSYAAKSAAEYYPYYKAQAGDSFYGLSKPQYSHSTYYQLANNGAGVGAWEGRWRRGQGLPNWEFRVTGL